MKKIIKLFLPLVVVFSPFVSFAYQAIPGCSSPSGWSTLTGESCATTVVGPVLKVVSPDTAVSLEHGSTYVIKWTSDQSITPGGLVSISFIDETTGTSNLVTNVKSTDGTMNSYSWNIPANIPPGKYRIAIFYSNFDANQCSSGNPECFYDKSDIPFNIVEKKPDLFTNVTLLSPNGGQQITAGTFIKIHWKQVSQLPARPSIKVFLEGVAGSRKLVSDYAEFWEDGRGADVYIDPSTPPGVYRLLIEDLNYSSVFDKSDTPITIVAGIKTIQFSLITPNGGEVWQSGGTYKLKWKVVPSPEKIKSISISFFDENLIQYFYSEVGIATSTNSGVMDFTVPIGSPELQSDLMPGKYKVAIGFNCAGWFAEYEAMRKGCTLFGVSAKPFTITASDTSTKIVQSVPEQATPIVAPPETVPTVSAQPVAGPMSLPEPSKRGFWKSISCFFGALFGKGCE